MYPTVEIQEEGYTTSDLDMFFTKYAPDQVGNQPVLVSIDGGQSAVVEFSQLLCC